MTKSRAEYLRAYRAAKRAPRPDHVCEVCGETFTPLRDDARFCSASCRGYAWRPITHHALHHHEGGFPLEPNQSGYPGVEPCWHRLPDDDDGNPRFCGEPAPWRHEWVENRARNLILHEHCCDEHIGAHVDMDSITVGERLQQVMVREGREARRRHKTRPVGAVEQAANRHVANLRHPQKAR